MREEELRHIAEILAALDRAAATVRTNDSIDVYSLRDPNIKLGTIVRLSARHYFNRTTEDQT